MGPVDSAGIPTANGMLDGRELPAQDAVQGICNDKPCSGPLECHILLFKDSQQNRATAKMTKID